MSKRSGAFACALAAVLFVSACSGGGNDSADDTRTTRSLDCAWPMFGRGADRTFAYPAKCPTSLTPDSVSRLQQKWFRPTSDVVTATAAIADDSAFVGDWSGKFYAISLADGRVRWTYSAPPQKNVYSGQIVASAAVADVGDDRRVFLRRARRCTR